MEPLTTPLKSLCIGLLIFPALAWSAPNAHEHEFLQRDEALTVAKVFTAALQHAPEAAATQARQQQADNYINLGKSWLPGRNRLAINYLDDRTLDDIGARELDAGLEFELWQRGARRESQKLGASYQQQTSAWQGYLQLLVAGRLRTSLANIQQREVLLAQAQRAQQDAQQLKAMTDDLFKAGATPRDSVLQAQSLLIEHDKLLLRAEAMLVDEERQYGNLTGLKQRPAQTVIESQSQLDAINASHPLLRFLQTSVDVAAINISKAKQDAKGNPTMNIGMRRQRGDRFEDYNDSLAIGFSIPFGGAATVTAQVSDARVSKVDSDIAYQSAYRQLNQQLHEVEHELTLTKTAIKLSREQAQLNEQRWQMANKAFKAGETTMMQVVLALQQFRTASTEYELSQLRQQRLMAEFNQTVGVLP
ncbi:MAG: TolC family protein [Gammaproteobacteria bacterium]|nr:TolC family protein [Gammaproteobacteria bacterium]MBQ0838262.1 TolC family protein [Gammaproteobacteria bacterium]